MARRLDLGINASVTNSSQVERLQQTLDRLRQSARLSNADFELLDETLKRDAADGLKLSQTIQNLAKSAPTPAIQNFAREVGEEFKKSAAAVEDTARRIRQATRDIEQSQSRTQANTEALATLLSSIKRPEIYTRRGDRPLNRRRVEHLPGRGTHLEAHALQFPRCAGTGASRSGRQACAGTGAKRHGSGRAGGNEHAREGTQEAPGCRGQCMTQDTPPLQPRPEPTRIRSRARTRPEWVTETLPPRTLGRVYSRLMRAPTAALMLPS